MVPFTVCTYLYKAVCLSIALRPIEDGLVAIAYRVLPFGISGIPEEGHAKCHNGPDFPVDSGDAGEAALAVVSDGAHDVSHVNLADTQ